MTIRIQNSHGAQINSVDDWLELAGPKEGIKQWKDGRSAKEAAKAWFNDGVPSFPTDLSKLLNSNTLTKNFVPELVVPEHVTKLDNFRGEGRNHDVIVMGESANSKVLLGIEAKTDESFGELIGSRISKAKVNSKAPARIELLSQAIFGRPVDESIAPLRYQLLHGVGGTLIEARLRGAEVACFIVHEFVSDEHDKKKLAQNFADFQNFLRELSVGKIENGAAGRLYDSFQIPGGQFVPSNVTLLIGKITTRI